jgi:hypothetical protein
MPGNNQYADELRSVGQPRAAIATSTPHCAGQLVGTRFSFDEWTLPDLGGSPRGSRLRFAERLPSFRAEGWSFRSKADGCEINKDLAERFTQSDLRLVV